jgi:hypothetical protein
MAKVSLPYSMEQDRANKIKANSVHVDANFNTLLEAVNNKIDKDGSTVPTADLPMGNHKVTELAQPTNSGDATTKGYVDALITELRNSIAQANNAIQTNLNNLKAIYPVGCIYIGTQSSCPMTTLIPGSEWKLVSSGRALWTGNGSNGNSTIEAGLPNITGTYDGVVYLDSHNGTNVPMKGAGALYTAKNSSGTMHITSSQGANRTTKVIGLDASKSNATYGNSDTVQPPAYVVNVWRRTA